MKNDSILKKILQQLVHLTGETVYIRSDIGTMKADIGTIKDEVASLERRTANGFKMVEKRFDIVNEQLQQVLGDADENSEQKVAKLRSDIEPRVTKLEHKVFAV